MEFIERDGLRIRYRLEGSGPVVTLAHALATDLGMWDGLAAELADRHTVLRYDARGHGGTAAPEGPYGFDLLVADLVNLLDALHIQRTDFVGLSMGGMIGQHFALAAPQRLGKLVIASSTSRVPPEAAPVWQQRIDEARAEGTAALAPATLERWFTAPFRVAYPEVLARFEALIAATPVAGYVGCAEAIRRLDVADRLQAINAPTLVIAGAEDPGTPPAAGQAIAAAIPGARLEVVPSASHMCCIEQARMFDQLVCGFLETETSGKLE